MSGNQPPPPPFGNEPPPQPPGGGYGAPPPQPPGGYGGPPPGGGGYGGAPMGSQPWDVGSAVSYGWSRFQQNMGQMILAALAIFLGAVVILGLGLVLSTVVFGGDVECVERDPIYDYCTEYSSGGAGFFLTMVIMALTFGLFFVYAQVVGAGIVRESLGVTNGQRFSTARVFKFDNIGPVLVTSVLIGVGTAIGLVLCYLPGIIFAFLTQYALYFLIDKNLSPVDSIKASFDLVKNNLGPSIIWYLVGGLIGGAGAILCGVGILFTLPIMLLGTAYTYKKLTGQAVAA